MKIFVAGATGAIDRRLVPALVKAGHAVTGMTRSANKAAGLRAQGAEPVVADGLDSKAVKAVMAAIQAAAPDVIVHQLTANPPRINVRKFDHDFALTNRLRTEGTDNLLAAARRRRRSALPGPRLRSLALCAPGRQRENRGGSLGYDLRKHCAKRSRQSVTWSRPFSQRPELGIVLRYGAFYGPGTSIGQGGSVLEDLRQRHFPVVGNGGESGRSSISTTPRKRRWLRSSEARPAFTTSLMMTPHRFLNGCRNSVPRSALHLLVTSRPLWSGWPSANPASS
jgi:hypothetical protein